MFVPQGSLLQLYHDKTTSFNCVFLIILTCNRLCVSVQNYTLNTSVASAFNLVNNFSQISGAVFCALIALEDGKCHLIFD